MIIHLMLDDKFGQLIIKQFNQVDATQNKFILVTSKTKIDNIPLEYANQIIILKVDEFTEYISLNIDHINAIVFHGLNEDYKWDAISEFKGKIHLHWMFWGTDGYMLPHLRKKLFKPETKKIRQQLLKNSRLNQYIHSSGGWIFNLYCWLHKKRTKEIYYLKKLENAIRQVDSISAVVPQDYARLANKLHLHTPHYPFHYGSVETLISKQASIGNVASGNNILIGNSASIENNHIDAFIHLKKLNTKDKKIIVPLNYGESIPGLKDIIIAKGNFLFGKEVFQPLHSFLPLHEYNAILQSCSITIMNHNKQHAMGNIISLLYYGTKLFLNKENTIFEYLSNKGFVFFDMQELSQYHLKNPLTKEEIEHNRQLILKLYDDDVVQKRTTDLYNTLIQPKI